MYYNFIIAMSFDVTFARGNKNPQYPYHFFVCPKNYFHTSKLL